MVEAPPERYEEMIELALRRCPGPDPRVRGGAAGDPSFADHKPVRGRARRRPDARVGGWPAWHAFTRRWRSLRVVVDTEQEGGGVGSALHARWSTGSTTGVLEERGLRRRTPRARGRAALGVRDPAALDQLAARRCPSPVPERALPDDVTVEASTSLEFPDQDAFDAMLDASQTNPERDQFVFDRAMLLDFITGKERPLGCCCGSAGPRRDLLGLGVRRPGPHRLHRGRPRLPRARAGLPGEAGDTPARVRRGRPHLSTDNEEHNRGIRHVNEALGYAKVSGSVLDAAADLTSH